MRFPNSIGTIEYKYPFGLKRKFSCLIVGLLLAIGGKVLKGLLGQGEIRVMRTWQPVERIEHLLSHPCLTLLSEQYLPPRCPFTFTTTPDVAPCWQPDWLDDAALWTRPGLFWWLRRADVGKRAWENTPNFLKVAQFTPP